MFILNFKTSYTLWFDFLGIMLNKWTHSSCSLSPIFILIPFSHNTVTVTWVPVRYSTEQNSQTEQDTLIKEGYEVNWKQVEALFITCRAHFAGDSQRAFFFFFSFFFFLLLPTHAIVSQVLPPKTKPQSDTPCCPLTTVKMLQATLSGHRCYLTSAKRSWSRALTTTTRSNNRVCLVKALSRAAKGLPLPPTSKWKHLMPFKVAAPKPPVGPLCWCLRLKLLLYEHSFFMLDLKKQWLYRRTVYGMPVVKAFIKSKHMSENTNHIIYVLCQHYVSVYM